MKGDIMVPTNDKMDIILRNLLGDSDKLHTFMTGVLLVDGRTVDANEYVLKYISDFNRESGNYIDFYLPGYISERDSYKAGDSFTRDYPISIAGELFYFQPYLYERAQDEYEYEWKIERSSSPMLILMDIVKEHGSYLVKQHLVISLKNYMKNSTTTVQELFHKIFKYAKKNTGMGSLMYHFRFRVLLGNHVPEIKRFLIESGVGALLSWATNELIG